MGDHVGIPGVVLFAFLFYVHPESSEQSSVLNLDLDTATFGLFVSRTNNVSGCSGESYFNALYNNAAFIG